MNNVKATAELTIETVNKIIAYMENAGVVAADIDPQEVLDHIATNDDDLSTTEVIDSTIDAFEKITVKCNEPNCRNFESGHEIYEIMAHDPGIIHERSEFAEVTVSRVDEVPVWDIEINARDEYSVAEAEELIESLSAAVADAKRLNSAI